MKESLMSEWNALQNQSVGRDGDKIIKRCNEEIRILDALKKLGVVSMPGAWEVNEMIQDRKNNIRSIMEAQRG